VNMQRIHSAWLAFACLACALLLAACGSSPTVQFYTLAPAAESAAGAKLNLALSVGPAEFPRGLARSQIVTRTSDTRVNVDQYHVWSAPLEFEFLRVLGDNIGRETGSDRIAVYPQAPSFAVDYRILLDVQQFDGALGNKVELRVRWAIAPAMGDAVAVGSFENRQSLAGDESYDALVAAHSAAIGALSRALTAELRELGAAADGK
jgi:uncharacterized lipoprotein YmbA